MELPAKKRIHNAFHMLLLEQNTSKKGQINVFTEVLKFELGDDKEYKVEAMQDIAIYAKEADRNLSGLYYLVIWKGYSKEKKIWEPSLIVIHLQKMVSTFQKDHPEKSRATLAPLDSAPPMAKLTVQLSIKWKLGWLIKHVKKRTKWGNKKESESMGFFRARSWQIAGDLSFWRKEHQGTYMVVDHWQFDFVEELHNILFWLGSSSNKSLFFLPISVFLFLSLV